MYRIILSFFLAAMLFGCKPIVADDIDSLKKPCVVWAKKGRDADAGFHGGYGTIILKSADGHFYTFDGAWANGAALIATYNVGDTIK